MFFELQRALGLRMVPIHGRGLQRSDGRLELSQNLEALLLPQCAAMSISTAICIASLASNSP